MKAGKSTLIVFALLLTLALPLAAHSFPIAAPGTEGYTVIVTGTGPVIATYEGNSATYKQ